MSAELSVLGLTVTVVRPDTSAVTGNDHSPFAFFGVPIAMPPTDWMKAHREEWAHAGKAVTQTKIAKRMRFMIHRLS